MVNFLVSHQQAVTYFHTFILPSSSTGLMSLQTACKRAVGSKRCPATTLWHDSSAPEADRQLLPSSEVWCIGDTWNYLSSGSFGSLSLPTHSLQPSGLSTTTAAAHPRRCLVQQHLIPGDAWYSSTLASLSQHAQSWLLPVSPLHEVSCLLTTKLTYNIQNRKFSQTS